VNIQHVILEVNKLIVATNNQLNAETNPARQQYLEGISYGLSLLPNIINTVNSRACDEEVGNNRCLGYGEFAGNCNRKIPKELLLLWCVRCKKLRDVDRVALLAESGVQQYNTKDDTE
jgi:hypothetical protein